MPYQLHIHLSNGLQGYNSCIDFLEKKGVFIEPVSGVLCKLYENEWIAIGAIQSQWAEENSLTITFNIDNPKDEENLIKDLQIKTGESS